MKSLVEKQKSADEKSLTRDLLIQTDDDQFIVYKGIKPGMLTQAVSRFGIGTSGFTNSTTQQATAANVLSSLPRKAYNTLGEAREKNPGIQEIDICPVRLSCGRCGREYGYDERHKLITFRVERDSSGKLTDKVKWCRSHDLLEASRARRREIAP